MCNESIIKAASTFISHAKSWFLLVLAKPRSILKGHLMYPWALKAFILTNLVALWRARLELYRRTRNSHPKWCFPLTGFQQNKPGFNRMKRLYQLLLPTVSCCSMALACLHSFPMEKVISSPSSETPLSTQRPFRSPRSLLAFSPIETSPTWAIVKLFNSTCCWQKQLKSKIITIFLEITAWKHLAA